VEQHWGAVAGATTADMIEDIERYATVVGKASGNPYKGKVLFSAHCGKCHTLFTEGGNIGPDLTAYQRDDLRRMLVNIVNPSIEIREGYENYVLLTDDGRTLTGFIADQDNQVVVLKGADGQSLVIPRAEIEIMKAVPQSLMPELLLKQLDDQQVRDLFAYLRSRQPLP
jgi:putative heme-binding domain-containing protein